MIARTLQAKGWSRNHGPKALGLLLTAFFCLAAAAQAQDLAQTGAAADDSLTPIPGLDPWNEKFGDRPQWDPQNAPPQLAPRASRHIEFLQARVPVEYRSQRSPYPGVPKAITAGGEVYRANCIACHGPRGRGDGDAGLDLVPSPALLTGLTDKKTAVDEYLLWTVSEGGQAFGTAMPAFKNRLSEDQIWQVIAYLRAGFPPLPPQ
ncbi:MAG: cytochrome c [Kiloniellaceae bacterium]